MPASGGSPMPGHGASSSMQHMSAKPMGAKTMGAGLSRDSIRQVQQNLQAKGYDPGPVDGVVGKKTRSAIAAFQKARGMPATGAPDAATISALSPSGPAAGSGMTSGRMSGKGN
jgi:peptidoglycan hydrolase-like protein with peptidoglycan-binding domain